MEGPMATERTAVATTARRLRAAPAVARSEVFAGGLLPIRRGDVAVTLGRDSLRVHVPPYQLSSRAAGVVRCVALKNSSFCTYEIEFLVNK